jgi:hypothetical protein
MVGRAPVIVAAFVIVESRRYYMEEMIAWQLKCGRDTRLCTT